MRKAKCVVRRGRPAAAGLLVLGLAALGFLGACATAPYVPSEKKVQKLVGLIDKGGVGSVKGLASAPFLLDGEILLRQSDVDKAWANFKASGLRMRSPKIASIRSAEGGSAAFAGTMEVRAFFRKYLDEDSSLVALDTAEGRYWLILSREVSGYPRIQGIRGPLK